MTMISVVFYYVYFALIKAIKMNIFQKRTVTIDFNKN